MQRLREDSRLTDLHHSPSMKQNRFRIFKGVKRSVTFNLGQNLPVSTPRRGMFVTFIVDTKKGGGLIIIYLYWFCSYPLLITCTSIYYRYDIKSKYMS